MKKLIFTLFALGSVAYAEGHDFSIGGMGIYSSNFYKEEDNKATGVPVINYSYNDRFYVKGTEMGYTFNKDEPVQFTPYFQPFGGLALLGAGGALGSKVVEGSDMEKGYKGIDDRETQGELGLRATYKPSKTVGITGDITGGEHGAHAKATVSKVYMPNERLAIIPQASVALLSKDFSDYYFGVSKKEAANAKNYKIDKEYKLDDITGAAALGFNANYYITENLSTFLISEVQFLSDKIKKSPIVEDHTNFFTGLGLNYKF